MNYGQFYHKMILKREASKKVSPTHRNLSSFCGHHVINYNKKPDDPDFLAAEDLRKLRQHDAEGVIHIRLQINRISSFQDQVTN